MLAAGIGAAVTEHLRGGGSGVEQAAPAADARGGGARPAHGEVGRATGSTTSAGGGSAATSTGGPAGGTSLPPPGEARVALTPEERRIHLLQRMTYGPTPELLAEIEQLGEAGFVEQQLAPAALDDGPAERAVAPLTALGMTAHQIARAESGVLARPTGWAMHELGLATLVRAVTSRRQLFETMVGFWTDHFNISVNRAEIRVEKPVDDRAVIRSHALGRFHDLLQASAHSPAMLWYLDNASSTAEHPNENYAREVLELHTVGAGNYTEDDVLAAARVLTGWTVDDHHRFRFDPQQHDGGAASVLGWRTAGTSGPRAVGDGEHLLAHLARHPATARHLAAKLCSRFVADDPPDELVEQLAAVYLANDTALAPVLSALFTSDTFFEHAGVKLRRPFDFVAFAFRATGATIDVRPSGVAKQLGDRLRAMGHGLFEWPAPDGYPDTADAWGSPNDIIGRWSLASLLAQGHLRGVDVSVGSLAGDTTGATVGTVVDRLLHRVLPGPVSQEARRALVAVVGREPGDEFTEDDRREHLPLLVATALASAEAHFR